MKRYRLSGPAKADIAAILQTSERNFGADARVRYRALVSAALRRIASDPEGHATVARDDLVVGLRSYHIRHSRDDSVEAPVAHPVHVIFYRQLEPDLVEIVRVLHDRMDVGRHLESP